MEKLGLVQSAPYWNDLKLVLTSRRRLGTCPHLNMMNEVRLLSLQHNRITKIQHLSHLHNLVFLNLSDNNISEMIGLKALGSLQVLMLGQNWWVRPGWLPTAERKEQHRLRLVVSPHVWLSSFRMDMTKTENCPSHWSVSFSFYLCDYRIQEISCLASLLKLNILDLHENQVPTSHSAPTCIFLIHRKYGENADLHLPTSTIPDRRSGKNPGPHRSSSPTLSDRQSTRLSKSVLQMKPQQS